MGDLLDNFDQKSHHQMADSDKLHTFAPWQIKPENQGSEEIGQGKNCIYDIFQKCYFVCFALF